MTKTIKIIHVLILFFVFSCTGNTDISNISQAKIGCYHLVDTLALDFLNKTMLPGISITVSRNEEIIYSKGFGFANMKQKIKMQPTTQVRTASVAKAITATALGRLVSEGRLDLDAPIKNYIPYITEQFSNLTCRQLAGHTAGVQHRPPKENRENKYYETVKETIALFDETLLLFEPDTDYKYSTNGYNLLAAVIEEISGKNYSAYMKEDIFIPLNMHQTFAEIQSELSSKDALMYYFNKGQLVLDKEFFNGSYKLAGAGFRSTSEDLAKMMNAYSNGFIASSVIETMFASHTLKNGSKTNVGIGWRLNRDINNLPTIEHAGNWQGARTVIVHYPKEQLTVALMINAQCTIFIEETAQLIAQCFLDKQENVALSKDISKSLQITNNLSEGTKELYSGSLSFSDGVGVLEIDTDKTWLTSNKVYFLGKPNIYALSTKYGLMYLNITLSPIFNGRLHQFQVLSDMYHPQNKPMLMLTEKG